jgi:hypothetical protein
MTIRRRIGALELAAKGGGQAAEQLEADAKAFSDRMTMLTGRLADRELDIASASPAELLASGNMAAFRDRVLASGDQFLMRAFRFAEPEDLVL